MYAYLSQEKMLVRPETLQQFCDESSNQIDWLTKHGVKYDHTLYPEPASFPPDGHFLYFSGNEKRPEYQALARPAPRGHRPAGKGLGGIYYFEALKQAIGRRPIRVMPHAPVRRLIVDASGAVIGVEILSIPPEHHAAHAAIDARIAPLSPFTAAKADKTFETARTFEARFTTRRRIRARAAVVVAAGGFAYNAARLTKFAPVLGGKRKAIMRLGTLGDDASGIDLGCSVGGATGYMDSFFVGRGIAPPASLLRGLLVNRNGERFASEDTFPPFLGNAMMQQPAGEAWLIIDDATYRLARKEALFPGKGMRLFTLPALLGMLLGGRKKAKSIARLAAKIGVADAALTRTVERMNTLWSTGADDLRKMPQNIAPFGAGPFHALNVSIGHMFAPTLVFSMGGLQVDERSGEVTAANGSNIHGLYAAGRSAVGLMSGADINGMSIADTVFSCRWAGAHAAARINQRASIA